MERLPIGYYASAFAVAAILVLGVPVAIALAVRRTSMRARAVGVGVLTFAVSQLFSRIPLVVLIQQLAGDALTSTPVRAWLWITALSLSAGLFEESARALGFRFLLRASPETPATPIAAGLGHGGLEAVVLVGVTHAVTAATFLWFEGLETLPVPAEARDAVLAQRDALAQFGAQGPIASLWERAMSMTLHVTLSVLVFVAVRARRLRLILLAIVLHGVANLGTVAVAQGLKAHPVAAVWISEAALTVIVLATAALVAHLVRPFFGAEPS